MSCSLKLTEQNNVPDTQILQLYSIAGEHQNNCNSALIRINIGKQ